PWETVTPSTTFNLGTAQSEYQAILTPYQDVESSVLMITTEDPDFTFWMDDLEIVEVQVEMVNPGELILFEYNASNSPKTVKLNGTYVDAKNKQHTGSVTIAPYGSVVLVKTSSEGIKEEEKALATTIQLLLPPSSTSFVEGESLELKADVAANGAVINKVNFYYGLKLIGSSTKSPYQTVWSNIPEGDHYVWASAI